MALVAVILLLLPMAFIAAGCTNRNRTSRPVDLRRLLFTPVEDALDRYKLDIGHYPTEDEGGLKALRTRPTLVGGEPLGNWAGPYLRKDPIDPWGNKLNYLPPDPNSNEAAAIPYKLWSSGPNLRDDGGGDDDIRGSAGERTEP